MYCYLSDDVLCCAVLCCAVLCCAVLCCAVLCCAVLCCVMLCCAVLCYAVLCCVLLCCAVFCFVLCCDMCISTPVGKPDIPRCECEYETPLKCLRCSDRCVDQCCTIVACDESHNITAASTKR
jgi:hypothetical protein